RALAHAEKLAAVRARVRLVARAERAERGAHRSACAPRARREQFSLRSPDRGTTARRARSTVPAMGCAARESSTLDRWLDRSARPRGHAGGVARRLDALGAHESGRCDRALRRARPRAQAE